MANRRGLRFLSKVYQNLPAEIIQRPTLHLVKKEGKAPSATVPEPIRDRASLEARLDRIELLLGKLVTQKRLKTVERDEDDLIVRVIDEPLNESEAT